MENHLKRFNKYAPTCEVVESTIRHSYGKNNSGQLIIKMLSKQEGEKNKKEGKRKLTVKIRDLPASGVL